MTFKTLAVAALSATFVAGLAGWLCAEKVPLSPQELRDTATHVVTGTVAAIYSRPKTEGHWRYTRFVAEVQVDKVEKGEGLAPGTLVYVRYWTRAFTGLGPPPPSTNGHRPLPTEGQRLRVYVARNAYDGFTQKNADGGFNVIGANGFEPIAAPAEPK